LSVGALIEKRWTFWTELRWLRNSNRAKQDLNF